MYTIEERKLLRELKQENDACQGSNYEHSGLSVGVFLVGYNYEGEPTLDYHGSFSFGNYKSYAIWEKYTPILQALVKRKLKAYEELFGVSAERIVLKQLRGFPCDFLKEPSIDWSDW